MLIPMTKEEKEIWIKQHQLAFMLKQQKKHKPIHYLEKIDDLVFNMTDDEVEENYKLYEEIIKTEVWVECYPMYFHISEFENALNEQLDYNPSTADGYVQEIHNKVKHFYKEINKSHLGELTLDEKKDLFWITHLIIY